jgi:hypothetical protein
MEHEDSDIVKWLTWPNTAKQMGNTLSATLEQAAKRERPLNCSMPYTIRAENRNARNIQQRLCVDKTTYSKRDQLDVEEKAPAV